MIRTLRAFWKALRLTARGEVIAASHPYPELENWVQKGAILAEDAIQTADNNNMPPEARKAIKLQLDHREISMETILQAVRHNMKLEYPMLLRAQVEHNLTTLYALNLDDRFRVAELAQNEALTGTPVKPKLEALSQHLNNIPSSVTNTEGGEDIKKM